MILVLEMQLETLIQAYRENVEVVFGGYPSEDTNLIGMAV